MRDECQAAVEEALGRSLRKGEAKDIEDAVSLQMRLLARKDPQAWAALSQTDRIQQAGQAAADSMIADLKLKQRRVQLQIEAHDRIENALNQAFERLPDKAKPGDMLRTVSQTLAFDAKGKGLTSVETWAHAIANESLGRLMPLWDSVKGFASLFENQDGVNALVKELFGEDSGNPAAKAGAKAWMQVTDELRDRANSAGMDIGKLDEWHYPQNHSQAKVAQAGVDKWTGDILPLLDRDKYLNVDGSRMTDDQVHHVLLRAYDSIIADGQNKRTPGAQGGYGSIANRMDAHRAIFFKDSDSFLSYQGQYGDRSLWPTLTGHIRAISRDIALTEMLGPNAEQTFKYFNDRTRLDELRMEPTAADTINKSAKFNESLFDYVAGKRGVVNQKIADIGQSFRNFETATKLGKVAITALGDEAGMSATAFANRVPWSEAFLREMTYLNPANSDDRAVAAHAGLGINGIIGGLNRFGYEDLQLGGGEGKAAGVRGFTAKLANWVMHASGAEAMWDARRRALGSVLMSYLGKTVGEVDNFSDINPQDHGILANKGVTEADWQTWKLAQPEDWGMKHGVLTPRAISEIPDEKLAPLGDPTALRRHASTMLLGHILEETGMGVMDTGARERAAMQNFTQAGTASGELTRSALLFKSFAFSMMNKHWQRARYAMPTGMDTASYAARLVVTGTVLGALANQIRNLVSGKEPANIVEPKFWAEAALRGGGLGFYGDFLYSEFTSYDTSLIPALMGPLATETENVWNLTGAAAFKAARGEKVDEGAKLVRYARSNIPFLNMWYTQAAFDHLIWNDMQEAANPGFLDRMQAKAYAQKGTEYWWQPQEGLPSSGPQFAKMFQPDRGAEQIQRIREATGLESGPRLE